MIAARFVALAALAGAAGLASAALSSPAPVPLRPLSEADQMSTGEMGCTCSFSMGRDTLVQMIGHEFMIRNRSGRQVCRITDAQFGTLADARGSLACGGLRLSLRRTGRVREHPASDSSEGPARLAVTQGRASRVLAGNWGCAC